MRLVPSDTQDFAYTVRPFRAAVGGVLRVKLADGEIRSLRVARGGIVNLPVRRIYVTGTTARNFTCDSPVADDWASCNLIVPYGNPPTVPPPPSPIVDWQFEGNLNDSSGNGHTLNVAGGSAEYVASPDGLALGGHSSLVAAVTLGRLPVTPLTIAVRAAATGTESITAFLVGVDDAPISPTNYISVYAYESAGLQVVSWISTYGGFISDVHTGIAVGEYVTHTLVLIGDGTWKAYINGVQIGSGADTIPDVVTTRVFVAPGEDGEGTIERIRIFDVALTAAQVAEL